MFLFFFITGLITSAFLNGYLFEFFSKRKLYDPINTRSSHNEKATRSGGAAIFLTLCFCYGVGRAFLDLDINLFSLIISILLAYKQCAALYVGSTAFVFIILFPTGHLVIKLPD